MDVFGNENAEEISPLIRVAGTFPFYFVQHCRAADKKSSRGFTSKDWRTIVRFYDRTNYPGLLFSTIQPPTIFANLEKSNFTETIVSFLSLVQGNEEYHHFELNQITISSCFFNYVLNNYWRNSEECSFSKVCFIPRLNTFYVIS